MIAELGKDSQSVWFIALLVLWAILLFGGFFLGKLNADGTHRMPTWARMASSFVLVMVAWCEYSLLQITIRDSESLLVAVNVPELPVARLIAIGMTLGFVGDLFMARLIRVKEPVLGGIGSFALGHVAYIIAFANYGDVFGFNASTPRWAALIFWWVFGFGGWYFVVYRDHKPTPLHLAALPYSLLLATTAGFATGLALQSPMFIPLAAGAILFLVSDLLLAAQLFNNLHFTRIGDVVWLLYGPGQMLIVFSMTAVMRHWL